MTAEKEHFIHVQVHRETLEQIHKEMLALRFPADKNKIAKLSMDQKLEWYAHQFQRTPGAYPYEFTTPEFESFWRWRVLLPTKFKRFFYRLKTGQIFKRYEHISEMKAKMKKHGI